MYKIAFYVPSSHVEAVKTAMFQIGAGKIGTYDSCAWQCLGKGQFRPLQGSRPYQGQTGKIETIEEFKVEMVCEEKLIHQAIQAMKAVHPYETPAYSVTKLELL